MKKHIYKLFMLTTIVLMSCSDLLDVEAENTLSGEVLTDTETIQKALNAAYYNLGGISDGIDGGELLGGDFILIPELLSRVLINGGIQEFRWETVNAPLAYRDFINKEILATNDRVAANWRRAYETINQVNSILAALDNVSDAATRSRIQGEALAVRGILYYEMVILWAPHYGASGVDPNSEPAIPLITKPILEVSDIPALSASSLATIEQVYIRAETDLTEASTLLEPFGTNGTALSYYACQAYLSKLYLQKGDYEKAEAAASNILNTGAYQLASQPLDAFNNQVNSSEDIFAVQQTLANNTGDRSSGIGITTYFSSLEESGLGTYAIFESVLDNDDFINSPKFGAGDLRATVDLSVTSSTLSSQITTAYYKNLANNFDELFSTAKYTSTTNVLPVVRLAEIYLNRAEAEFFGQNEVITQQAVDDLNSIRSRAGLDSLTIGQFSSSDAFFDSLALERTREFMHEGMLLEDLKRWGGFVGYDEGSFSVTFDPWDEEFVLPIPQSETDTWD